MALAEDRRTVAIRLSVLQYLIALLFSVLAVSFWVLQVAQHEKYAELAENNNQRTLALRAPRGVVFDRNGTVLVENRHSYSISIVREHTKDLNRTIRLLASLLGFEERGVREIVDRHRREPTYRPIMIVQDATLPQVAAVTARRLELPDVVIEQVPTRQYHDTMAAHLFGYVGEVNDAQIAGADELKSGDVVGQSGIEKVYNNLLMGEDGAQDRRRQQRRTRNPDARRRSAIGRAAPQADDRRRRAESARRRLQVVGVQRRRRHPRSAQRRGARVHERAGLRPERVRQRDRPGDVGVAQHRRAQAAAGSRDSGALLARLDVQDGRRDRRARGRHHHAGLQSVLSGLGDLLRPPLPVLEAGRARHDRSAARDRAVVQRLLLHGRQHGRDRPHPQVGDAARPRREERHRPAERSAGPRAVARVEEGEDRREVVRRRNDFGLDRSGPGVGHAGVDGGLYLDDRQRRHARHAAPSQGGRRRQRVEGCAAAGTAVEGGLQARDHPGDSRRPVDGRERRRHGRQARGSPGATCPGRRARRR